MAEKALVKISPLKIYNNEKGYSLVEIIIVIVLIGLIFVLALPKLSTTNTKIRAAIRQVTVISKEIHHTARIKDKTFRFVFEMNEKEAHKYWVESGSSQYMISNEEEEESSKSNDKDEKDKKPKAFSLDTSIIKKPKELPSPIYFKDIELGKQNKIISKGQAYIHYLPQGFVESAAVHLTDGESLNWTLFVNSLTGEMSVHEGYKRIKDFDQK